jgi:hypothetical protein
MVGSRGGWDGGGANFDRTRYLEHTDDEIKHQLSALTSEVIEKLLTWPVLFAYEFSKYDDADTEVAWVGRLTSIKVRYSKIRITFEFDPTIPPITVGAMRTMLFDLDIEFETTRMHWAVKEIDLFEVLKKNNLMAGQPAQVRAPELRVTSEAVKRAIDDAEHLIESGRGATSALDRVHTMLHGYLIQLCVEAELLDRTDEHPSLTAIFKRLREKHPKFKYNGPRISEVGSALKASSSIIEAINTLRNNASVAHPNEEVVPEPEAMYLINLAKSLLHYIEMKRLA